MVASPPILWSVTLPFFPPYDGAIGFGFPLQKKDLARALA
jgi:hypothetical protein